MRARKFVMTGHEKGSMGRKVTGDIYPHAIKNRYDGSELERQLAEVRERDVWVFEFGNRTL